MPRTTPNPAASEAGVTAATASVATAAAPPLHPPIHSRGGVAAATAPFPPVDAPAPARKRRKAKKRKAHRAAASRPVRIHSPLIEPMEQQIGQDRPRLMKSTGPARESLEPQIVQAVDRPVDPEKLEMLAFMEEIVTVHIHTTSDPQADQVFEIFNNGVRELFRRDETKTVKRKFVNELATRKITTFTQIEKLDGEGVRVFVQIPHTALRYPFSVVRDDHARGADWLKHALAQA